MNTTNEARQLAAIAALLASKADEFIDSNFHIEASDICKAVIILHRISTALHNLNKPMRKRK